MSGYGIEGHKHEVVLKDGSQAWYWRHHHCKQITHQLKCRPGVGQNFRRKKLNKDVIFDICKRHYKLLIWIKRSCRPIRKNKSAEAYQSTEKWLQVDQRLRKESIEMTSVFHLVKDCRSSVLPSPLPPNIHENEATSFTVQRRRKSEHNTRSRCSN